MNIIEINNGQKQQNQKTAIIYMIFSVFCFSSMTVIVKYLKYYPLMETILFRSLPTCIITSILIISNQNISIVGNNIKYLWIRAILGLLGNLGFFYACQVMNLTDATTIRQLTPFFIVLLAGIFLRESIQIRQIFLFVLAFFGALMVIKPGLNINYIPGIISIIAALISAWAHVIVRKLRETDNPLVIVNYFAFFSFISATIILLINKQFITPTLLDFMLFFLLGILGFFAQFTLTIAYKIAPAGLISFYMYLMIIFAAFFDIMFFNLIPDNFSIVGAIVVLVSGYLNYKWHNKNNI